MNKRKFLLNTCFFLSLFALLSCTTNVEQSGVTIDEDCTMEYKRIFVDKDDPEVRRYTYVTITYTSMSNTYVYNASDFKIIEDDHDYTGSKFRVGFSYENVNGVETYVPTFETSVTYAPGYLSGYVEVYFEGAKLISDPKISCKGIALN